MSLQKPVLLIAVLTFILSTAALAGEVVVPFVSGSAEIADAGNGQVNLEIPEFSTMGPSGNPALPFTGQYVLLPPNADTTTLRIEIRNAVEEKVPGVFSVSPVPPAVTSDDGRVIEDWGPGVHIENGRNTLVYNKNNFYPENYATLGYDGKLGKYQLVPVEFWPYRYNPKTGELTHLVSGDVAITFDTPAKALQSTALYPDAVDRLSELAVNWKQASDWYGSKGMTLAEAAAASTPLAIITTSSIVNSSTKLSAFVTHKTNMGFSVTVATESQWGGGTGDTAAENIRNWLKNNYATKAKYAILIGNPDPTSGNVPMKMLWPRSDQSDDQDGPSDYYYADLTGNWDLNGNGKYGESVGDFGSGGVDRIPEVLVGRIPYYGSISDLDSILQKIITYETTTSVGGWADRMLLPMKPLDSSTPMWQLGDQIRQDIAVPAGLGSYRIYDENYSASPTPELTPCTIDNVKNEWVNGYGFVIWSTHGSATLASSVFQSLYCVYLDDSKPSFTFQTSCLNGQPEYSTNLGYYLLRKGAIATVSASRVSWYYPGESSYANTSSNAGMAYRYTMRLAKERQRCGDAFYNMKTSYSSYLIFAPVLWANHVVFNLYGDPTIKPRWASICINTASLPLGKVGSAYSSTLSVSGGTTPYTWSMESGSLPAGLTLSSGGVISGTPTTPGSSIFTIKCVDGVGRTSSKQFSINIAYSAYTYNFDTASDWTLEGAWAIGQPAGGGSYNHDPSAGYTGKNVLGYNLKGDYTNLLDVKYATTKALDCSVLHGTALSFWRWLGVDSSFYDSATIQVSKDNTNWTTVYSNSTTPTSDSAWTQVSYDISAYADGQPTVYIRWGMGPTDNTITYPGWNIDDVEITGSITKPFIRHTSYQNTDMTTASYAIIATIITADGQPLTSNPILHWKADKGSFNQVTMTLSNGNYVGYIPAQAGGTLVSYYIEATNSGGTTYSPAQAPTVCYSFNVILDTVPPVIVHTPLSNTSNAGPYPVTATVTDNWGVSSVVLTYSKNGGSTTSVTMTESLDRATPDDYTASIPGSTTVGDWYLYKITATDKYNQRKQSTSPASGYYMFSIIPATSKIYSFPLDSNPGWACDTGWAFGIPTGGGSSNGVDPTAGYDGSFVYGYNLSGNYDNNMASTQYLTTTAIDCSNLGNTTLKFRRWLGVEGSGCDHATIQVSNDGVNWTTVWSNSSAITADTSWTLQTYDISAVADYKPHVYIRWGMGPTDSSFVMEGWNIDNIEIWGNVIQPVGGVGSLKNLTGGQTAMISNTAVSAVYQGCFYAQERDGFEGIRVAWPGTVTEGALTSVHGRLRVRNGELELVAAGLRQESVLDPVSPVYMTTKTIGGAVFGLQGSTWSVGTSEWIEATGLNNTGTLVTVCGNVIGTGSGYFYVDDGCGLWTGSYTNSTKNTGVYVQWPSTGLTTGQFVTVTGISSGYMYGGKYVRMILPRRQEDIR
ncbi:MAG: putative Ig domain-containing protein [Armatimonadota bacterium]